jgi:hypothetical protein
MYIAVNILNRNQHSTHASGKSAAPRERFTHIEFQALHSISAVSFPFTALFTIALLSLYNHLIYLA